MPVLLRQHGGGVETIDDRELDALRAAPSVDLIEPRDPRYEGARRVWNGLIDRRPGLIARCRGAAGVAAIVRFAAARDLCVAVRGGGHNVAGVAVPEGGLMIDLSGMRSVRGDAQRRVAQVGGGATIGDVDAVTVPLGLATPLGLVSETGVGGFTLHGGYGWMTRKHGLAVDNLMRAEVVLASGDIVVASDRENADLFWALRGGGGNFGVVTGFDFRLHPVAAPVWFSVTFYPLEESETVLRGVRDFAANAPEELGLLCSLWTTGLDGPYGEEARGVPAIGVLGCHLGAAAEGERAAAPLRRLGKVVADLSGPRSYLEVQRFFDEDYPSGRLYYWKSLYLRDLSDHAIDLVAAVARGRPSLLSSVDVWLLHGAASRVGPEATAFYRRSGQVLVALEANFTELERSPDNIEWARAGIRRLQGETEAESYLNFPGFAEEGEALLRSAYGANCPRLSRIKQAYDPRNLFRGTANIAPAGQIGIQPPAPPVTP